MFFVLIPTLLILFVSLCSASLFKARFSSIFPITIFAIILVLYFSYIFNKLALGRIFVIVACLSLSLFSLVKARTDKQIAYKFLEIIKSPSFIIFLFFLAFSWFISLDMIVQQWDALRLWGAYPKALYSTEELQLGTDALLFQVMQSYPPAMPLFCYFMLSFGPVFNEHVLFFAYDFFIAVLILHLWDIACEKFLIKRNQGIILSLFSIIFIWCLFAKNLDYARFFNSIFIDPTLGICSGYCLFLSFYRQEESSLNVINLSLSCACLALLKDSGAFIALFAILGGFIGAFASKNRVQLKMIFLRLFVALAALAAVWFTWSYLLNIYSISNHIQMSIPSVSWYSIYHFFIQFIREPITEFNFLCFSVSFSLMNIFLLYCLIKSVLLLRRKTDFRSELTYTIAELLCYILFFIGYCFAFSNSIVKGLYPSYTRYLSSLVTSAFYVFTGNFLYVQSDLVARLVAFCTHTFKKIISFFHVSPSKAPHVLSLIVILFFGITCLQIKTPYIFLSESQYDQSQAFVSSALHSIPENSETTDVYLVVPGDISILHHRIYFDFLDKDIRVVNFYNEANISSEGCNYSPGSFISELISRDIKYVLITDLDETHYNEFGSILGNASVGDTNLIFRVDKAAGSLVRIA